MGKEYSGTSWHAADTFLRQSNGGRGMDRRKIGNNTRLERRAGANDDDIAVRLHGTDVVTYHSNGTVTLNHGGWRTVTTMGRINGYGPARVYSHRGHLCIWHASDPTTPARVQKCRQCKGTGRVDKWESAPTADNRWAYRVVPNGQSCYACSGEGTRDYGSRGDPIVWEGQSITVDSNGRVCHSNGDPIVNDAAMRLSGHAEADRKARRESRERRKQHEAAMAAYALELARAEENRAARMADPELGDGARLFYKGVDDNGFSPVQSMNRLHYTPGAIVDAGEVDLDPMVSCGKGINFCRTVEGARGFGTIVLSVRIPAGEPFVDAGNKLRAQRVEVVERVR